jgi:hypothetical protein
LNTSACSEAAADLPLMVSMTLLERFSADLTGVLKDSVEKAVERIRKAYKK